MSLFTNGRRKLARETAHRLIAGHTALLAFWALKHAGVLEAIAKHPDGLEPKVHAAATNMSPETLTALLEYLARQEFMIRHEGHYRLTPVAEALLEQDDGVLEHLYAYQPVLQMLEHLLARLKTYGHGINRKYDAYVGSQARRFAVEVYPAIDEAVRRVSGMCLLDLNCGTGELLTLLGAERKEVVGVGISADGMMVRQANDLITQRSLDKRLIAVPAPALELCIDARQAFDRVGISPQLWERFDCLIACTFFSDHLVQNRSQVVAAWRGIATSFPHAALIVAEPCAGARLERNYYAAEFELLEQLTGTELLTREQWVTLLQENGLRVEQQVSLTTDGMCLFICPPSRPKPARLASAKAPSVR